MKHAGAAIGAEVARGAVGGRHRHELVDRRERRERISFERDSAEAVVEPRPRDQGLAAVVGAQIDLGGELAAELIEVYRATAACGGRGGQVGKYLLDDAAAPWIRAGESEISSGG